MCALVRVRHVASAPERTRCVGALRARTSAVQEQQRSHEHPTQLHQSVLLRAQLPTSRPCMYTAEYNTWSAYSTDTNPPEPATRALSRTRSWCQTSGGVSLAVSDSLTLTLSTGTWTSYS